MTPKLCESVHHQSSLCVTGYIIVLYARHVRSFPYNPFLLTSLPASHSLQYPHGPGTGYYVRCQWHRQGSKVEGTRSQQSSSITLPPVSLISFSFPYTSLPFPFFSSLSFFLLFSLPSLPLSDLSNLAIVRGSASQRSVVLTALGFCFQNSRFLKILLPSTQLLRLLLLLNSPLAVRWINYIMSHKKPDYLNQWQ